MGAGDRDKVGAGNGVSASSVPLKPEWPTHFPPGCPCPACMPECRDVNERVYRIVRIPRNPLDAESHSERNLSLDSPPCQRAGLSSHLDLERLREVKRTRGYWKDRFIAAADLRPEHGRIAPTLDRSHHTLWLRAEHLAKHDALFAEVIK
jgi:hypothetical protein